MKILVVGGSGFIGKNFLLGPAKAAGWECIGTYNTSEGFPAFLEKEGAKHVRPIRVDMTDPKSVATVLRETGDTFDACLFVMGNSEIAASLSDPMPTLESGVIALINLLRQIHVGKFVFMSSGSVYEGHKGKVDPSLSATPSTPYSISKLACERYIEHFAKRGNIGRFVCLRFFGAYGPYELPRKIYTQMVHTFALKGGKEYTVSGDGHNYIDAMYIGDAVDGIRRVIESDKGNLIVDFCYGTPLTINELIRGTAKLFGAEDISLHHQGTPGEYTTFYASPSEMETLFEFKPHTNLRYGLHMLRSHLEREAWEN